MPQNIDAYATADIDSDGGSGGHGTVRWQHPVDFRCPNSEVIVTGRIRTVQRILKEKISGGRIEAVVDPIRGCRSIS
jgi:hypothetical protein